MDFTGLRRLSERNEIRIDEYRGHMRTPPHHYDSLRHALGFYFNTFNTQNAQYDFYAEGLYGKRANLIGRQFLDEENTILTIITFERFFELFLKDLLKKTNLKLVHISKKKIVR